jgi:hypothetical protein
MDGTRRWDPADWVNRGGELLGHDPRLAQRLIGQGLQGIPQEAIAWFNLGIALHQQRRIDAAIRAYRRCLALPGAPLAAASNNLAQDLLLNGQFHEGWQLYERRLQGPKHDNRYFDRIDGPAWRGFSDPRPCQRLVLVAEQGFGDTLQFCRLAWSLEQRGITTVLFCQPALVPLLQASTTLPSVCCEAPAELFDGRTRWCPLLSLPQRLGLDATNIPLAEGYLRADPARVAQWGHWLQRRPGHRLVALHWQGNPKHEGSLYSRGRSMTLEQWLPLAQLPGVEWVSIQKGPGSEQLERQGALPLVAGQGRVSASLDFRDTAAVLAHCDLLISADSGVVHLAGTMGVPTWVALRWIPEWRWLLNGDRSPWYTSVRLFRQTSDGDWISVVQRIAAELRQLS